MVHRDSELITTCSKDRSFTLFAPHFEGLELAFVYYPDSMNTNLQMLAPEDWNNIISFDSDSAADIKFLSLAPEVSYISRYPKSARFQLSYDRTTRDVYHMNDIMSHLTIIRRNHATNSSIKICSAELNPDHHGSF
ncbi:unnamed protein product [Thelazia callipaeda]|uniref:WD_REPEATS_REGION domain-containing protein n=1 Tax=Thelazia callipaeda TaxID=103827 RepID=A0A0N5D3U4_THECL|nr:unnamed protein product [Thelazia callipaeda]